MAPAVAAALISLVPAAIQVGTSIHQSREAKRLADQTRPEYEVPPQIEQMLLLAKERARRTELPGQKFLEQELEQVTARNADTLERFSPSGAAAAALATKAHGVEMGAKNRMGIGAAKLSDQREKDLIQAMNLYAGFEDKKFDINELQPYLDDMAASSALNNAAINNAFSGLSDMAGVAAMYQANKPPAQSVPPKMMNSLPPSEIPQNAPGKDLIVNAASRNMSFIEGEGVSNPNQGAFDLATKYNLQSPQPNQYNLGLSGDYQALNAYLSGLQPQFKFGDELGPTNETYFPPVNY